MSEATNQPGLTRKQIAWRVAQDIEEGAFVNLGIGQPEQVANYLPTGREIIFHSENGILGMGPFPYEGDEDPRIINAGKQTVTITTGGSCFDSATSFTMIRGGHVDLSILGARLGSLLRFARVGRGRVCALVLFGVVALVTAVYKSITPPSSAVPVTTPLEPRQHV